MNSHRCEFIRECLALILQRQIKDVHLKAVPCVAKDVHNMCGE